MPISIPVMLNPHSALGFKPFLRRTGRHPSATVGRPAAAVHHHFLRISAHDAVAARVVEGIRNAASHAGGGAWGLGCGWAEMLTAEMLTIPQRKKLTTGGKLGCGNG